MIECYRYFSMDKCQPSSQCFLISQVGEVDMWDDFMDHTKMPKVSTTKPEPLKKILVQSFNKA
jgi:hypothetical protein